MSAAPPKFIKENNIRRLNPAYKVWADQIKAHQQLHQQQLAPNFDGDDSNASLLDSLLTGGGEIPSSSNPNLHSVGVVSGSFQGKSWKKNTPPVTESPSSSSSSSPILPDGTMRSMAPVSTHQKFALPVISSVTEHSKYLSDTPLSSNVIATKLAMEQDHIAERLGIPKTQIMNNLNYVFAKFEVPLGILEKLMELEHWDNMIFTADDSSSMLGDTDARHPETRQIMTRWEECELRIRNMIEVLAYVPSPPITIMFLNRPDVVTIKHQVREPPYVFIGRAFAKIRSLFHIRPRGSTPMLEAIQRSMKLFPGTKTLRYVLADGVPSGGKPEINSICQLLIKRPLPQNNPFTLLSCTNDDAQVEWMKELEERAPFCAELDDFHDESNEVHKDQGRAFNFSYGLWLVCNLVAAINPFDLDCLDESAPLTKKTLDRLQGYVTTKAEYNYYFEEFMTAQGRRPAENSLDRLKKSYHDTWRRLKPVFFETEKAGDIPEVEEFRLKVRGRLSGSCCVIQ